jgi:hypothetical protein
MDIATTLDQAVKALKAGRKAEARRLLEAILVADQRNEQAWMWMSGVVERDDERVICLENVLSINPANERARNGLESLRSAGQYPSQPIAPLPFQAPPSYAPPPQYAPPQYAPPPAAAQPVSQPMQPISQPVPASAPVAVAVAEEPEPEVNDYRLYIIITVALAMMLICTVASIVLAVTFLAPPSG